ncbi:MAG: hypothetical protein C0631_14435 [Sedimenticola sp.]|mgnify:FL=1|jgi:protein SCO1/2|nr:MAG: hypothetical protein C0631_14435 [Sedimenticola sp.]
MRRKHSSPYQKILLFIIAMGALYGGYFWGSKHNIETRGYLNLHALAEPKALGSFQLLGQNGEPFSNADFDDHWNLVIVGHPHSESSTDQLTLAVQIYNRLADAPDLQKQLQTLFLNLDSENTNRTEVEKFLTHFNPDFLALDGDTENLEIFTREIGATFKITGTGADQRIVHSTSIALIAPDGRLIGLFTGRVDAVSISTDLKTLAEKYKTP